MKRFIARTTELMVLICFLAGSAIAILDFAGFLDTVAWKPDYPKLNVLLIGMLGTAVILQYWLAVRDIERDSAKTLATVTATREVLAGVDDLRFPARLLAKRDARMQMLLETLQNAPAGTIVDVTHFEKLRGVPFDVGVGQLERLFMDTWKTKVCNGDITVRQIIHVASLFDIEEVETRLRLFGDRLNYSLSILVGIPPIPFVDMVLFRNQWACLDVSADGTEPFYAAHALSFTRPEIIETLQKYFEVWWNRFGIPVKTKDGVNLAILKRLRGLVPAQEDCTTFAQLQEFTLLAQRNKQVKRLAVGLVDELERLAISGAGPAYESALQQWTNASLEQLTAVTRRGVAIPREGADSVLLDVASSAQFTLDAISVEQDQVRFWSSGVGRRLFEASEAAVARGVKVRRIFVLSNDAKSDKKLHGVLREQVGAGVDVYHIQQAELGTAPYNDFVIQDDQLVFEMNVNQDQEPVKAGMVFADSRRHRPLFDNLLIKCIQYNGMK